MDFSGRKVLVVHKAGPGLICMPNLCIFLGIAMIINACTPFSSSTVSAVQQADLFKNNEESHIMHNKQDPAGNMVTGGWKSYTVFNRIGPAVEGTGTCTLLR